MKVIKFFSAILVCLVTVYFSISTAQSEVSEVKDFQQSELSPEDLLICPLDLKSLSAMEISAYEENTQLIKSLRIPESIIQQDIQLMELIESEFYGSYEEMGVNIKQIDMARATVSYPLPAYPVGNYFNKFETQPCRLVDANGNPRCAYSSNGSHGDRCSYSINDYCDCKIYNGAIQCMGFADKIFYLTHGVDVSSSNELLGMNISSVAAARDYVTALGVGSNIRLDGSHSIIVSGYDLNSISIYEANYLGKCKIGTRKLTWTEFYNKYGKITKSWNTTHSHKIHPDSAWTNIGTKSVCRRRSAPCMLCNASYTETLTGHVYTQGNSCYYCGYTK